MATGIYCILNIVTGDFYVGSAAKNMGKRWRKHINSLRLTKHHNYKLQKDWNSYGPNSFRFSVLEFCRPEQCIEREQYYIDTMRPSYNICRMAGSILGIKRSPETRAKISAANKGRTLSVEQRARLSASLTGRPGHKHTPEARAKISAAKMGKPGHLMSPGTRAKMSAALMGNTHTRGYHHTQEARAKMVASHKNILPETRSKLSAAAMRRWHPSFV